MGIITNAPVNPKLDHDKVGSPGAFDNRTKNGHAESAVFATAGNKRDAIAKTKSEIDELKGKIQGLRTNLVLPEIPLHDSIHVGDVGAVNISMQSDWNHNLYHVSMDNGYVGHMVWFDDVHIDPSKTFVIEITGTKQVQEPNPPETFAARIVDLHDYCQ